MTPTPRAVVMGAALPTPDAASAFESVSSTHDGKDRRVAGVRSGSVDAGVTTRYGHDEADSRKWL